jgi:glycosyltransferase involved in cell wall biosynthesis
MAVPKSVAILVMSHNSSSTIAETIDSLLAQRDLGTRVAEVCLADDASSDDTVARASERWTSPVPLRVMARPHNLGQWGNCNDAMRQLAGRRDWVLLVHADDILKPNWLALMTGRIDACAAHVATICSSYDNLYADGHIVPGEEQPEHPIEVIEGTPRSVAGTLHRRCWWHISGCAIRCAAFQQAGPFMDTFPYMADWEWLLRILSLELAVEYVPRTLLLYRHHDASVSSGSFACGQDILDALDIIDLYVPKAALARGEPAPMRALFAVRGVRRLARQFVHRQWRQASALAPALMRRVLLRH